MISITLIPILSDNYAYLLEGDNGEVAIVDPGEAAPIIEVLKEKNITPDMILITHHHWDHMDGVPDMLAWHSCPLIGANRNGSREDSPAKSRVNVPFEHILDEGSDFSFAGEMVQTLSTPGHTPEHLCFYFKDGGFLLAGDMIFAMGCGRVLDGTAELLYHSLQKIAALPDNTKIYAGHEYTLANAEFCAHAEPENTDIQTRLQHVRKMRAEDTPTLPTILSLEKKTNVFLRADSAEALGKLRKEKNSF